VGSRATRLIVRRALSIFEQNLPADTRLRDAIDAAHAFAGGGQRTGALWQSGWAAYRAAREAAYPLRSARHERRAMRPALRTFIPRQELIRWNTILGVAAHAARAEELASGEDRRVTELRGPLNGRVITHQQRSPRCSAVCPPPPGGWRVREFIRDLDAALRA